MVSRRTRITRGVFVKIQVETKEKDKILLFILEIGKDCTPEQAQQLIDKGIATIIEEVKP